MNYLNLSHLLVPESRVALQTRFRILQAIATYQPIGRRALAKVVQMSERTLRNECEDMKALDLIEVQGSGMRLTEVGEFILERSDDLKNNFIQMSLVEHKVAKTLGVQYVKVWMIRQKHLSWYKRLWMSFYRLELPLSPSLGAKRWSVSAKDSQKTFQ